jgi:magnesium transporter
MSIMFEIIEPLVRESLEQGDMAAVEAILNEHHPADIADILERLEPEKIYLVFQLLDEDIAAEVLNEMGGDSTRDLFDRMPHSEIGDLLDQLPMDDAVEILTEDVPELQEALLAEMDPEDAAEVVRLLQHPPESAGMMMTERFVRVTEDMTAAQVLAHTREVNAEVETVTNMYVLNPAGQLVGVIALRDVINQDPDTPVRDFMATQLVTVPPEMDQERVARTVARYNFLAIPVVDEDMKLLGIITVDDIIDVLTEENSEDILRFGGVEAGDTVDQPYFTISLFRVIRMRFGWLLLLMLAATLTDAVMRHFETQLSAVVALTFYIPLLIGTGGNTGAQTVSTIIRGLAVQDIRFNDIFRVLRRELVGGLLLGLPLGIVAATRIYVFEQELTLALVVGLSILLICMWANTMGALIPMVANRMGLDAALVSAPMISTLVDATGLLIYLSIATLIFSTLGTF